MKILKNITVLILLLFIGFSIYGCGKNEEPPVDNSKEKIDEVVNLISELPSSIDLSYEDALISIKTKYDALTIDEQSKVYNHNKFERLLNQLEELKKEKEINDSAELVIKLIDELPSKELIKYSDKEQVVNVRNKVNELANDALKLVTNLNKLEDLEAMISLLVSVDAVEKLIDKIPSNVTLDNKIVVSAARSAYEDLDNDLRKYVSNYDKLTAAENEVIILEGIEELKRLAKAVDDLIDALPSAGNITLSNKTAVVNARNRYKSLSAQAKQYVTLLDKLEACETKIAELEEIQNDKNAASAVDKLIDALPSSENITLNDETAVLAARNAYDKLTDVQKSYVTKLNKLTLCEEKIKELIENKEYLVTFVLNGGFIPGASSLPEDKEICKGIVNYVNNGFFQAYQTDVFIYTKDYLITDTGNTYLYALKVGFSLVNDKYVVDKIIPSGTGISQADKTSDLFIFVHSSNPLYSELLGIEIGTYVKINGNVETSTTANITYSFYTTSGDASDSVTIKYKGMNTLPIPTRDGYDFIGWFTDKSYSKQITDVSEEITVYARWTVNRGDITTDTILNSVSDIAESDTLDVLISQNDEATFTWTSSNPKLYVVKDGYGTVSKQYQTHKCQKVTITVNVVYKNGSKGTYSKEITVNPVKFETMPSTPVATYFYVGALSSYKTYSDRYKREGTVFSDSTKKTLDILYYSSAVVNSDGTLSLNTSVIDTCKELKNEDVRVILVLDGVSSTTSKNFYELTQNQTTLNKFVNNIMDMVEKYNFDGVDIDWEYVSSSYPIKAAQMNALVKTLREEMDRRSDKGGTPYYITAAIPSSSWGTATDRFDFKTLDIYMDYINIMSYDLNNPSKCSHLSPLYTSSKDGGYGFGGVYGINRMSSLGFSKSKLIIGAAGYGKAYNVSGTISSTYPALGNAGTLTKIDGVPGSFASGTLYGSGIEGARSQGGYVEYIEKDSAGHVVGSYLYNDAKKIFISYDSTEVIFAKYDYVNSIEGAGIMWWAYTEDTNDHIVDALAVKKGVK